VWKPSDPEEAAAVLAHLAAEGGKVCLRGAGRSYGDAAVLSHGDVLDLGALDGLRFVDSDAGVVEVEAGATVEQLWRASVPRGFWPAVVPGTMRPTVGGCVGMNIHGKNHFRAGGFAEHVEELDLALPDGSVRTIGPASDAELFRAVAGGFGLLGVITRARLRLERIHSGLLKVGAVPTASLAAMHAAFESWEKRSDYLVGWIDCFDRAGRGLVHAASHLGPGEDPDPQATLREEAQDLPAKLFGVVPRALVATLLRPLGRPVGARFVNLVKATLARVKGEHAFRQSHVAFAFLLDYVPGWKRVYDPGGLIQYQTFVPRERALEVHARQLELCRERGIVSWLGVYKRHRSCATLMAHALDGYSLALDFPVTEENRSRLWDLCHEMDEFVLAAGGRFYFAKDLTATPEALERAYPGLPRFRELKR
jgi:FAD/FMN-containing dehydrogenase